MIDKAAVLPSLASRERVSIELGCGTRKRHAEAISIDALDYPAVDIVGDVFEVLRAFPDASVDAVYSAHFFEHIADLEGLLRELARIMKPRGALDIVVPHFSNPYFYSDPTHKTHFGLYTFAYFAAQNLFSRQVPSYEQVFNFELLAVDLVFKSTVPFYARHGIKRLFGLLFNSCYYMKEFYEENFSYIFPCYELYYRLRRLDGPV